MARGVQTVLGLTPDDVGRDWTRAPVLSLANEVDTNVFDMFRHFRIDATGLGVGLQM